MRIVLVMTSPQKSFFGKKHLNQLWAKVSLLFQAMQLLARLWMVVV